MRYFTPILLIFLFSTCTHEPDYTPTGASGPGGEEYVALVSPSHGQTLTGFGTCSISASASQGVDEVDFYVDNEYKATDRSYTRKLCIG
jgi:hypothetical protein